METVLIDTFIIPEEAKAAFLERAQQAQSFIKTLPGFVEGFIYEQRAEASRTTILTIAVWESEAAIEQAKRMVEQRNQQQGINPQQATRQLGIEFTRAIYGRRPY